jgi:hypothetical protein
LCIRAQAHGSPGVGFLKELDITEGCSTGIPKILRAMKKNGSPPPEFEFDEDHSYFPARLPVHRKEKAVRRREPATTQVTTRVEALLRVMKGEQSREEIQEKLNLANREHFRKATSSPRSKPALSSAPSRTNRTAASRNIASPLKSMPRFPETGNQPPATAAQLGKQFL